VLSLRALRLDIDYGNGHKAAGYTDKKTAAAAISRFIAEMDFPQPMVVESGGGFHVYWPLEDALPRAEWQLYANGLKAASQALGLLAGHEVTADAARILRPPGTMNHKLAGKPRAVELDPRYLGNGSYPLDAFAGLLVYARASVRAAAPNGGALSRMQRPAYLRPFDPKRIAGFLGGVGEELPLADASAIAGSCAQISAMRATRGVMPEPTWKACLDVLAFCEGGERLAHEWSAGDPRYDPKETQRKFERGKGLTGATTCAHFAGLGGDASARCEACPHKGKINSPISLGMRAEYTELSGSTSAAKDGENRRAVVFFPECFESGKPKAKSYANTAAAIDGVNIRGQHDVFHDRKIISGEIAENISPELSDAICRAVREKIISTYGFDPGKENVQEVLERLCERNRFDPVCDYFDSLQWDGVARIDSWLMTHLGAEDTPLNRSFSRKVLVAAVRRARQPGCKFDTMLVLEGPQGAGKSRVLRILAGDDNFTDAAIKWEDQQRQQEAVQGALIHEISELAGLRKAGVENVKHFLSRQSDKCRPAYGRYVVDRQRRGIFIGTINNIEGVGYLTDPTGNRRFWPVKVGVIDLTALARDRDQLWAEAAALEVSLAPIELEPSLYEAARGQQELRRAADPWADILARVSGEVADTAEGAVERISSEDLLGPRFLNIPTAQVNRTHYARLATAMRALRWEGPKVIRLKDEKDREGRVVKAGRLAKGYERPIG
jgi:hypothetical protein